MIQIKIPFTKYYIVIGIVHEEYEILRSLKPVLCDYPGGCGLRVGNKCDLIEPCEKYVKSKNK